jgi:dolichol-phosphate mannosyltransferase
VSAGLSVVVPTYEERGNVAALVGRLSAALGDEDWELVVVDDDSPDGTAEVLRALGHPRVRVEVRVGRRGLASAVIEGVGLARGDLVAVMDADLQHDPRLLPPLVAAVRGGAGDVAVASRFVPGGDAPGLGQLRLWGSVVASALVRWVTGLRVADPFSGCFVMRREDFRAAVPRLTGLGFKILLDLLLAHDGRLRVVELPARLDARLAGASKFDGGTVRAVVAMIRAHRRARLR